MVVSGNIGMGVPINNIISDFVEMIADKIPGKPELYSTEHQLNKVETFNTMIETLIKSGDLTENEASKIRLIGADVKALFPSMTADRTARLVNSYCCRSGIEFKSVNGREAALLVARLTGREIRSNI